MHFDIHGVWLKSTPNSVEQEWEDLNQMERIGKNKKEMLGKKR